MNPHSTGVGGGGFMMVYIRSKKQGTVIDFRESAPKKANKDMFDGDPQKGIKGKKRKKLTHTFKNTLRYVEAIFIWLQED